MYGYDTLCYNYIFSLRYHLNLSTYIHFHQKLRLIIICIYITLIMAIIISLKLFLYIFIQSITSDFTCESASHLEEPTQTSDLGELPLCNNCY
jgi:hypothetical protein